MWYRTLKNFTIFLKNYDFFKMYTVFIKINSVWRLEIIFHKIIKDNWKNFESK